MTKRHRSFGVKSNKADETNEDQLTFDLTDEANPENTQVFVCRPGIQGAVLLEFVSAAEQGSSATAAKIMTFFDYALTEESLEKFNKFVHDPDIVVELETLSDIVGWLVSEYTDRPTKEPTA